MAHQDAIVITTAPSERQVRQILWREIGSLYLPNKDTIKGKITQTRLDLAPRRFAIGFTANSDVSFQGFHSSNLLAIVDEASGVSEEIYDAVLICLTSSNSKLLLIGNPTKLAGTFYDAFHEKRNLWHNIHISALETPAFQQNSNDHQFLANARWHPLRANDHEPHGIATPAWANTIVKHHGEKSSAYQVRVLGQFPEKADDTSVPAQDKMAPPKRDLGKTNVIPAEVGSQSGGAKEPEIVLTSADTNLADGRQGTNVRS